MAEVRPCTEIGVSSSHLLGDYSSRLDTVRSFLEHGSLVCAISLIVASTTLQTLIKYWYRDFPIDEIQAFRDLDPMVLTRGFNEILARRPIIDSQPYTTTDKTQKLMHGLRVNVGACFIASYIDSYA